MPKPIALAIAFLLLVPTFGAADVIRLADGRTMSGRAFEGSGEVVFYDGSKRHTFHRSAIRSLRYEKRTLKKGDRLQLVLSGGKIITGRLVRWSQEKLEIHLEYGTVAVAWNKVKSFKRLRSSKKSTSHRYIHYRLQYSLPRLSGWKIIKDPPFPLIHTLLIAEKIPSTSISLFVFPPHSSIFRLSVDKGKELARKGVKRLEQEYTQVQLLKVKPQMFRSHRSFHYSLSAVGKRDRLNYRIYQVLVHHQQRRRLYLFELRTTAPKFQQAFPHFARIGKEFRFLQNVRPPLGVSLAGAFSVDVPSHAMGSNKTTDRGEKVTLSLPTRKARFTASFRPVPSSTTALQHRLKVVYEKQQEDRRKILSTSLVHRAGRPWSKVEYRRAGQRGTILVTVAQNRGYTLEIESPSKSHSGLVSYFWRRFHLRPDLVAGASEGDRWKALEALIDGANSEKQGSLNETIGHYRRAIKIFPNYYLAHNNLGVILIKQKQFSPGVAHLRRAYELFPHREEGRHQVIYGCLYYFYDLLSKGKPARAEKVWQVAHGLVQKGDQKHHHRMAHGYHALGVALIKQGKRSGLAKIERAHQWFPDNPKFRQTLATYHYNRAMELLTQKKSISQAGKYLKKALHYNPKHHRAYQQLKALGR